jgi:hypothetical protein
MKVPFRGLNKQVVRLREICNSFCQTLLLHFIHVPYSLIHNGLGRLPSGTRDQRVSARVRVPLPCRTRHTVSGCSAGLHFWGSSPEGDAVLTRSLAGATPQLIAVQLRSLSHFLTRSITCPTLLNSFQSTTYIKSFKMSAITDGTDGPVEQVKVLFTLFPGYNTMDVAAPLEVLSRSLQDPKDKGKLCIVPIHPGSWLPSIGPLLTLYSQQGLQVPVRRHGSCHDVGPGPHPQGRHGLRGRQ